jgi:chromosome segregation ATPase
MADEATTTEALEADAVDIDAGDTLDVDRAKAAIAKKNQENKSLRARLKELEARDAKLAEIENASKTELERLQERLASAESEALEARLQAAKAKVVAEKGLGADLAEFITGSSAEEIEAQAERLASLLSSLGDKPSGLNPVERLRTATNSNDKMALNGDPLEQSLKSKLGIV